MRGHGANCVTVQPRLTHAPAVTMATGPTQSESNFWSPSKGFRRVNAATGATPPIGPRPPNRTSARLSMG